MCAIPSRWFRYLGFLEIAVLMACSVLDSWLASIGICCEPPLLLMSAMICSASSVGFLLYLVLGLLYFPNFRWSDFCSCFNPSSVVSCSLICLLMFSRSCSVAFL